MLILSAFWVRTVYILGTSGFYEDAGLPQALLPLLFVVFVDRMQPAAAEAWRISSFVTLGCLFWNRTLLASLECENSSEKEKVSWEQQHFLSKLSVIALYIERGQMISFPRGSH